MKRWTENEIKSLENMSADNVSDQGAYEREFGRPWSAIKQKANLLNIPLGFVKNHIDDGFSPKRGRPKNPAKQELLSAIDKLEKKRMQELEDIRAEKGSPENIPAITHPERIDLQTAALLAADFYFNKLIQLKEKGGG